MAASEGIAGDFILGYMFRVNVTGYDTIYVKKCKIPGWEFKVVKLRSGGRALHVKRAGGEEIKQGEIEVVFPEDGAMRTFWEEWKKLIRTHDPTLYLRDMDIALLGHDSEPKFVWDWINAWPPELEYMELDAEEDDKPFSATVKFEMDDCKLRVK